MKAAGVDRCHINLETSAAISPHLHHPHLSGQGGQHPPGPGGGAGGVLRRHPGDGGAWEDRIDMALDLAALGIGSIPLNILRPIPGTPSGTWNPSPMREVLRAVAIFRYLNPTAWIRMAAGRGPVFRRRGGAVPLRGQRGHHRGYAHHHRDQHGGRHGHAPGPGLSAVMCKREGENIMQDQMTSGAAGQKNKTYALAMTALMAAVTCVLAPWPFPSGRCPSP